MSPSESVEDWIRMEKQNGEYREVRSDKEVIKEINKVIDEIENIHNKHFELLNSDSIRISLAKRLLNEAMCWLLDEIKRIEKNEDD